jgi:hypothetical protein
VCQIEAELEGVDQEHVAKVNLLTVFSRLAPVPVGFRDQPAPGSGVAGEEKVEARRQEQDVGSGHHEHTTRLQDPRELAKEADLVVHVLDALGVEGALEGFVVERERLRHVTASTREPLRSALFRE